MMVHSLTSASFFVLALSCSVCVVFATADSGNNGNVDGDRGSTSTSASSFDDVLDDEEIVGSALDPHPDPNDENYEGMIYIGRHEEDGKRMGFEKNNGEKFEVFVRSKSTRYLAT